MVKTEIQYTIDQLDELLDRERRLLLDGDLQALSDLHAEKSMLINRLNGLDEADRPNLLSLRDKVDRNQDLLNAAMEGIRAVSQRLAEVRRIRTNLETYDSDGKKRAVKTRPDRSLEKRA